MPSRRTAPQCPFAAAALVCSRSHSDSLVVALTRSPLFLSEAVVHGVVRRSSTVRCDAVRCGCCGWRAYLTVFALSLSLRVPRVTIAQKRRMMIKLHHAVNNGVLCYALPCRAVPCRAVPCCAVPCRTIPCRACRAVLCRAVPPACVTQRWPMRALPGQPSSVSLSHSIELSELLSRVLA